MINRIVAWESVQLLIDKKLWRDLENAAGDNIDLCPDHCPKSYTLLTALISKNPPEKAIFPLM